MNAFVEAIIVMDEDGNIERFNKAAEQMFGYQAAEAIGGDISMLMPDPDHSNHALYVDNLPDDACRAHHRHRPRIDGPPQGRVAVPDSPRGRRGLLAWQPALHRPDSGPDRRQGSRGATPQATHGHARREPARDDGRDGRGDGPRDQPAAGGDRDLRVGGRAAARGRRREHRRREVGAAKVKDQSHRAGEIIRKLRTFVKPETLELEVDEHESGDRRDRSLAELDARANNIRSRSISPTLCRRVIADGLQIQQVILNLLRNGIDAMHDCDPDERRLELHGYISAPDEVRFDVIDQGHGIPESCRQNLFNPFFTTKSGGMGMGLAISQTIVKSHGGRLGFEDNPGGGTTFYVTLPTKVA